MSKKILYSIFIIGLTLFSCSEEELILEGNEDTVEDVTNDESTDNEGNSDENANNSDNSSSNDCDNSNSNEVAIANEILYLLNGHRQNIGKSTLQLNCLATKLAIVHTEYMIEQNQISHDGFSSRFQELQQYENAKSAGENVASGYATAESVMYAWLNSDGHRANIEGNFTHIGIAAIKNSQGRLYFTQLFYR